MSSENVEFIKGIFSGFDGADSDAIREMLPAVIAEICDPEIEFVETYREFYDEDAARAALGN